MGRFTHNRDIITFSYIRTTFGQNMSCEANYTSSQFRREGEGCGARGPHRVKHHRGGGGVWYQSARYFFKNHQFPNSKNQYIDTLTVTLRYCTRWHHNKGKRGVGGGVHQTVKYDVNKWEVTLKITIFRSLKMQYMNKCMVPLRYSTRWHHHKKMRKGRGT